MRSQISAVQRWTGRGTGPRWRWFMGVPSIPDARSGLTPDYRISKGRKSLTLVCVGPVITKSQHAEVGVGVVACQVVVIFMPRDRAATASRGLRRRRRCPPRRRCRRCPPPMPIRSCPCSACARPRQNSPARPPRPRGVPSGCLRTVTVVSPPERMTQGRAKGVPRRATARASAACTLPTSRDSPSISSLRMCASTPATRAAAAAASSDCCGVAIRCTCWPAKTGSPGLGVSSAPSPAGS